MAIAVSLLFAFICETVFATRGSGLTGSARYAPMRQSLLVLYQALDFQPFRRSEPSLQALEYVSNLAKRRKRVTAKEQRVGKEKLKAPLGHLIGRWRKHTQDGKAIIPNYYEAAARACTRRNIHEQRRTATATGAPCSSAVLWLVISSGTAVSSSRTSAEIFTAASAELSDAWATRREPLSPS
jgi:hypothetical protein